MAPPLPLSQSLAHVDRLLDQARPGYAQGLAFGLGGDPYTIDLPTYRGGLGGQVSSDSLRVLAALYFQGEIEGTYLMSVAEELAEARYGLNLTDPEAAQLLETLGQDMQSGWVTRDLRNQIFARSFGLGFADPNLGDTAVNQEFEPRFARVCSAIVQASQSVYGRSAPDAVLRLGVTAQSLMNNLAARLQGNTLLVTERISHQLRAALAAVNHPGLAQLFSGANAWDVVRAVLGPDVPNLEALIERAQTGMRILTWLSHHLSALRGSDPRGIESAVAAEPQLIGWADGWLRASGLQTQSWQPVPGYGTPPGYQQNPGHAPAYHGYGGHSGYAPQGWQP